MNIDELINNIRKVSAEQKVQKLADLIQNWKTDEKNTIELRKNVEQYLGNAWIDQKADFEKVYAMWLDFRDSTINRIDGMTMNERLYGFGSFDQFDNSSKISEHKNNYSKLMAEK